MAITKDDIQSFSRFAGDKISAGEAESMQELLDQWIERQELEQSVSAIRASISQHEAGNALPVEETFDEIRKKIDGAP